MPLSTLEPTDSPELILEVVRQDGAVVVRDLMRPDTLRRLFDELAPCLRAVPSGTDDFTGFKTQRFGALVSRAPACRALVTDELVLKVARAFLAPYTERINLNSTQVINILPGQGAQVLHRDRQAWVHVPRLIEPQFNTLWALTDFTRENGATRVVPGSQEWDDARAAKADEVCQAEMRAGSVLFYTGSVLHGGGENGSSRARIAMNLTYCLAWLRLEENQYLSCPPRIARDLDPKLQELLGYTMGNYALGYYSDPEAPPEHAGLLPPEVALGRAPRGNHFADPPTPEDQAP